MDTEVRPYKDYIESNIQEYTEYQRRALSTEPEMTKFLKKLLEDWVATTISYRVLDVGCGNGNTCFHLNALYPHWQYVGIDIVADLIEDGQRLFSNIPNLRLKVCDAHNLQELFPDLFDLVLLWRVLQGLEDWKKALKSAYNATRSQGHLIVSTLLNEADVDILLIMRDYTAKGEVKDAPLRVFSQQQFESYCFELGAQSIQIENFDIPITLPRPERGLNTYTVDLEDGHKLQLAGGALVDHWKIVHIITGA